MMVCKGCCKKQSDRNYTRNNDSDVSMIIPLFDTLVRHERCASAHKLYNSNIILLSMQLTAEIKSKYAQEILELYKQYLNENPKNHVFFGIIENEVLQAVASIRVYHGHWYFRGCVVKPEFRGRGLQRELIRERIQYLQERDKKEVRISISPKNTHSIAKCGAGRVCVRKNKRIEQ